jgi:putative ATP-binding cassette transporter
MLGQVELNDWNGRFFDAVGRKDLSGFVHDVWTFLIIIAVLLALTVAQTFLQERLKFRLREWIARHLLVEWLKPMRIYQLSFAGQYGHNPDQRIQEDTRLLGDYSADLGCGMVYSLLQIVAFVGVLWVLSAQVTFQVAGYDIAIPGYMVWCALAYALIGSGLTWLVGRPLCARGGIPLRPRSRQRIRRKHCSAWRGEGRTTTSRCGARGGRAYHATDIFFPRSPHLDHIRHWLAVARR